MSVIIKNKPSIEEGNMHRIDEYCSFIDDEGDFFLITDDNVIVLMKEKFSSFNLDDRFDSIEEFLDCEFSTHLIQAYDMNDFNITIDIK